MKINELRNLAALIAEDGDDQELACVIINRDVLRDEFPKLNLTDEDCDRLLRKLQNRLNQHFSDDYDWAWEIEDILRFEKQEAETLYEAGAR